MDQVLWHRNKTSCFQGVQCCESGIKYYGTGNKLVVSNTEAKLDPSKMQILPLPAARDGKVTYICLIEDFYPNVIKVTWEADGKNEQTDAIHGKVWPPDDNQQSYSVSTWLTIDQLSSKKYNCKYEHEMKPPQTCINNPENVPTLSTDITERLMHRTAYLIYIVLLLKSTMYYVIVLFFTYRMRSPIKRHGKKP